MDRREYLLTVGAMGVGSLVGCVGSEDDEEESPTQDTTSPTEEKQSAEFVVTNLSLSESEMESGETVEIRGTIENIGEESGKYTAALKIDGDIVEGEEVELQPGTKLDVMFSRSFDEAGDYNIQMNNKEVGTVTVIISKPTPSDDIDEYFDLIENRAEEYGIAVTSIEESDGVIEVEYLTSATDAEELAGEIGVVTGGYLDAVDLGMAPVKLEANIKGVLQLEPVGTWEIKYEWGVAYQNGEMTTREVASEAASTFEPIDDE